MASIAAVDAASELASHFNAELCILHVVSLNARSALGSRANPISGARTMESSTSSIELDEPSYEPEPENDANIWHLRDETTQSKRP